MVNFGAMEAEWQADRSLRVQSKYIRRAEASDRSSKKINLTEAVRDALSAATRRIVRGHWPLSPRGQRAWG